MAESINEKDIYNKINELLNGCRKGEYTLQVDSKYISQAIGQNKSNILKLKDQMSKDLIPFEVEITKSKEGGRGVVKYMLFSERNLRIYDNVDQYLSDLQELNTRSKTLQSDLDILSDLSMSDSEDIFSN